MVFVAPSLCCTRGSNKEADFGLLIEMQTTLAAGRRNWQSSPGGVITALCCFWGYRLGHVCNCLKRPEASDAPV